MQRCWDQLLVRTEVPPVLTAIKLKKKMTMMMLICDREEVIRCFMIINFNVNVILVDFYICLVYTGLYKSRHNKFLLSAVADFAALSLEVNLPRAQFLGSGFCEDRFSLICVLLRIN